jgi:hypothetical protein
MSQILEHTCTQSCYILTLPVMPAYECVMAFQIVSVHEQANSQDRRSFTEVIYGLRAWQEDANIIDQPMYTWNRPKHNSRRARMGNSPPRRPRSSPRGGAPYNAGARREPFRSLETHGAPQVGSRGSPPSYARLVPSATHTTTGWLSAKG